MANPNNTINFPVMSQVPEKVLSDSERAFIRQNFLGFVAREAKSFQEQYYQTNYLKYLKKPSDSPALSMVKEQIFRESQQAQEAFFDRLLKILNEYHYNNDIKKWENLAG